jgi:hypothetical protein
MKLTEGELVRPHPCNRSSTEYQCMVEDNGDGHLGSMIVSVPASAPVVHSGGR